MKKQNDRKANETKSESSALTDTTAATSRPVHRETGERSISSNGAIELIRAQAYRLFELRGRQPGHELDDWLQAERGILRQSSASEDRGFTCSC